MRTLGSFLSTLLAAGATVLATATPATATPVVDVGPGGLPRGAAPSMPYVDGTVVVDGDRRLTTGAYEVRLLGTSGDDVVVGTTYADGRSQRVLRLAPDGTRTVVARGVDIGSVRLSADGSRLVRVDDVRGPDSRIAVLDVRTGRALATATLRGYPTILDVDRRRVLIATYGPDRTLVWRPATDRWRTVMRRAADLGSFAHDRLAWVQGDPYDGGCTRLARLRAPREVVWRSCRDAVTAISPDGSRITTVHKLTDGLGPGEVRVREADGTLLATYRVRRGWFRDSEWESGHRLLLLVNGRQRAAWVRCTDGDCERATPLRPAQAARAALRTPRIIGSWSGSRA